MLAWGPRAGPAQEDRGPSGVAPCQRDPSQGAAYGGLGRSYRQLGDLPAAIAAFKTYLRLTPDAADRAEVAAWVRKHGG